MEFVAITPYKFMKNAFQTSNKTLVLAHLVGEGNEYQKACLNFKQQGGELWLDNSYYELRKNMGVEWLVEKARLINADVIVFPDTPLLPNLKGLVQNEVKHIRELGYKGKILMCTFANNKSFEEDLEQFKILNTTDEIDIIAVPYVFRQGDDMRRPIFLKLIEKEVGVNNIKKYIHLFGCNSLKNLAKEKKFKWVRSIDSTLPWKLGWWKVILSLKDDEDISRPKNYFNINSLTEDQQSCITYNLGFIKEMLNG